MCPGLRQEDVEKGRRQDMTLANSVSSFKPFKNVTSGYDCVGALVVERFNYINQLAHMCASSLPTRAHLSKLYRPFFNM